MAETPETTDITTVNIIKQIQAQLASLETSYANLIRTYYDMFYNPTPMDISIQIYNEEGELKTITVPNRAKSSTSTLTYAGSPAGVLEGTIGTLVINTVDNTLWYKTTQNGTDGWYQLANYNALSDEYLKRNGNGELLTNLNASSIDNGRLEVAFGGTGSDDVYLDGVLKMVPQTTDTSGRVVRAHIAVAESGVDYLDTATLAGMIVFFPVDHVQAGYLICNGDMYRKDTYSALYNYLTNDQSIPCPFGETDEMFATPTLSELFIRCTTDFEKRAVASVEEDGVPNFKGTLSMEITGGEKNFTGAVKIILDSDENYKQVDGKSSAPSGSYDYLIELNPQEYNEACKRVYKDDLDEVRVKNIALVPAIKY